MKDNKLRLMAIGFFSTLCLCLGVAFAGGSGFYLYDEFSPADRVAAQATIPPEDIPTRLPDATPTGSLQPNGIPEEMPERDNAPTIADLDRISVLPFSYSDEGEEGVAIDLVFYDAYDEVITFTGTPIEITMAFYAFTDFLNSSDISAGDLVYTTTVTRDHSSTLDEMFDNYIRIPYAELDVDQNTYISFGSVHVTVDAPSGSFEDTSMLVSLYAEQE